MSYVKNGKCLGPSTRYLSFRKSQVPGTQFLGPGCQGPSSRVLGVRVPYLRVLESQVPESPVPGLRVPGLRVSGSGVLGSRVSGPDFRLSLLKKDLERFNKKIKMKIFLKMKD